MGKLIDLSEQLQFTSGYKHQVKVDFHVFIPGLVKYGEVKYDFITLKNGHLTIHKGFGWDGASGLTYDTNSSYRGSALHDALYRLIRHGLLPEEAKELADLVFRFVCIKDEMWEWRANAWYIAVSKLGGSSVDPRSKLKVRKAPCDKVFLRQ